MDSKSVFDVRRCRFKRGLMGVGVFAGFGYRDGFVWGKERKS